MNLTFHNKKTPLLNAGGITSSLEEELDFYTKKHYKSVISLTCNERQHRFQYYPIG
jgi:hypothetical protein